MLAHMLVGIGVRYPIVPKHDTTGPDGNVLHPLHDGFIFNRTDMGILANTWGIHCHGADRSIGLLVSDNGWKSCFGPCIKFTMKAWYSFKSTIVGQRAIGKRNKTLDGPPLGT